ncbi:efflux RND transporter permease subunit [Paragemmobacter ruber]|uniref:AcrB/AcrD/AcrF family protein n=1 Tax=Paragemmobacter ruber TaxID=1985673 RepID=A0ABW9YAG7_9RHOB|nr:efflux RND transporter permease subunit [Rhodobacter ruber]NBE09535.1 AcrB/AcrD/AcrF family protein [Rhodobacter ruber]
MNRTERNAHLSGTALFIRRPILAFVLNALIVIAGVAGYLGGEVRELPEVDRPVITVSTDYPGAAPETIDREITSAIEGAAGRVAGVSDISSSSRFGRSRVTVEFSTSTDLDVAATDMRDAIARIQNDLPEEADPPRIVKADANAEAVMRLSLTSPQRSPEELTQLAEDLVEERLLSVEGVADLQIFGDRAEVFRIDINMQQLAARGLSLADMREAVATVSFDAPAGSLASESQSLVVRTTAAINSPEQFEAIILGDGVRLGDVAQVSLGPALGESILRSNGEAGVGLGILRAAASNTLSISADVNAAVAELQPLLPEDVTLRVTSDDATFVAGALNEVVLTLIMSTVIVVAVIYAFLFDLRATLVPAVAMPVALIGTLATIYMAGFSINILTLLALVLATGMVVDDAIVVLENIVRRRSEGMGARAAAVLGTQQVFFAVVTTTATLAAVFVPLSFLPGEAGGLFREFGFTLAMAVLLSSVVALTLCPVLASRVLKEEAAGAKAAGDAAQGPFVKAGAALSGMYRRSLEAALAVPVVVVVGSALFAGAAVLAVGTIRQELTPPEDRATVLMRVEAPQGVSLDYTFGKMREVEDAIAPLVEAGEVRNVFAIAGSGGAANAGFMVLTLAPWGERERSQQEIAGEINRNVGQVIGVRAFAIQPNSLRIRGAGQGLSFALVGPSYEELSDQAGALVEAMEQNPAFGQVRLGYDTTQPQLFIEVDRERASDLGISIDGLGEALQAVLDGRTVGTVFIGDRSHDIQMISTADPVNDPSDLERIFMRSASGENVPVSAFVRLEERAVAPELGREAQQRSVPITAGLTPELSLGPALAEVERLAADILPPGSRIVPLAEAAALNETGSGLLITFGFAILIVFLVLAAQFESFISAIIVMSTVPLGLACAVFALILSGGSLNVYSQIGLVLLVGIMAKNGILIVEFANQLRDAGKGVREAILEGSVIRLRPVMMTMVSTVLGGVPLILSTGPGAEAREALGWVIVGGLGLATVVTLYLTPVVYLLLAGWSVPKAAEEARLRRELDAATGEGSVPAE